MSDPNRQATVIRTGSDVRVIAGPLAGSLGHVIEINRVHSSGCPYAPGRARVTVSINGTWHSLEERDVEVING
jgi:transcription antitermination factor NusG